MYRLSLLLTLLTSLQASGQSPSITRHEISLSGGKIMFGTGDISGYTLQVQGAKQLNKQKHLLLNKLLLGAELAFETGVKNPVIMNPTAEEFISRSYYHISNTIGTIKLMYYPFGGFAKGLHISVGPAVGYSNYAHEAMATNVMLPNGNNYRSVMLRFSNTWLVGYKVGTGYDVYFGKKLLAGLRLDFENFNNGDINTSYGLKAGIRL